MVQTAEAAYAELDPAAQRLTAELLLRLVTVDEDTTATGRRAELTELLDLDPVAQTVVDRLAEARLVTVDEDTVQLAHESLVTAWPRLRALIDDDREALRNHRKITEAARIWVETGRDGSTLAAGSRLALMQAQVESAPATLRLTTVEREFLDQSAAEERRVQAAAVRRAKGLRALTAAAVVCALVAAVLAGVAGRARTDALAARDTALSQQMALTADELRQTDPTLAGQLAVAGYGIAKTRDARSSLLESATGPTAARYLGGPGPTAMAAATDGGLVAASDATDGSVRLLTEADGRLVRTGTIAAGAPGALVYALALSPDDRLLAVGDTTATIALWDVTNPRSPRRLATLRGGPQHAIERLAFAPSGDELAAAGGNGVFRWDTAEPTQPRRLARLPATATTRTVSYDAGGDRLAFGTDSGEVQLWDVADDERRTAVLAAGDRPVPALAFAPDGGTLVTGSHDRAVRVYDVTPPQRPRLRTVLDDLFELYVTTVAVSPDGQYLAAGSSDSTMRVIDTSTWTSVQTLPHPDVVTWATFTDDGQTLASVATDGAVRLWDLATALPQHTEAPILDLPFSADGHRLAAFSAGQATVWDTTQAMHPTPLAESVTAPDDAAAFSGAGDIAADGELVAAGSTQGDVHLYDLRDPLEPRHAATLGGSAAEVFTVAFSPDGSLLAAAGRDNAVRLWDVSSPGRPRQLATMGAPRDVVLDLDWAPGGRTLAAASADSKVYLYDLAEPAQPRRRAVLDGLDSYVYSATFSPDGDVLAIGGVDSTVLLWDVHRPDRPHRIGAPLSGPSGRIFELTFHPRGHLLAGSVIDGTTWLWDVSQPRRATTQAVLAPTGSPQNAATFRPTGDALVAGGGDQVIRTWRTNEAAVIERICARSGDRITKGEWRTYLPDLPYDPPCRRDGTPA